MTGLISLAAGSVKWEIAPALLRDDVRAEASPLFDSRGPQLDGWLRSGQARVVKQGPHRRVVAVSLPGVAFHVKEYREGAIRGSKARLEFTRTQEVAARGVPTLEPLAAGEHTDAAGGRRSYFVTRTVPDVSPLWGFLEETLPDLSRQAKTILRQQTAVAMGRFLAKLHDAGVTLADMHPGNLLVRLTGAEMELFLIDLYTVRLGPPLPWLASAANLVVLNRWFMLRSEHTDRLRFWHAYRTARATLDTQTTAQAARVSQSRTHLEKWAKAEVRELESGTLASNLDFWRGYDRRCLENNRQFKRVAAPGVVGHAVRDFPAETLRQLLADPDAAFRDPAAKVLKQSKSVTVVEVTLPLADGPRPVIVKRLAVTRWTDPWVSLFRRPPALRAYLMGHTLRGRLLPTPRPLAVLHRRRFGLLREGYVVTEKVPAATELTDFVRGLATQSRRDVRAILRPLVDDLARLVALLHQRRLSHRDLKASNVLVSEEEGRRRLTLIDLVGVTTHRHVSRSRRVQNLARLHTSFHAFAHVSRTDKLRFLRVYLRWGLRSRQGWKDWWRAVAAATDAKVRRNQRLGRPIG